MEVGSRGLDLSELELKSLLIHEPSAASPPASQRSSLDLASLAIPLPPTHPFPAAPTKPPATMSLLSSVFLVVGSIIGSGVFASPGPILARVGSVMAAACVWVVAGVLSSLGAACYAELGCALPVSGGEPVYLERAYGEMMAFLYEWTAILAMKV